MNKIRLQKIIQDMKEVLEHLEGCKNTLESDYNNPNTVFIEYGLKQIFVDFFITVEDFTSMMLKELKKFKIGIDMKISLQILLDSQVIDEDIFVFLNEARLIRNRISHRYKEPTKEELLEFINTNLENFPKVISIAKAAELKY